METSSFASLRRSALFALLVLSTLSASPAEAMPDGQLDTSFGDEGLATWSAFGAVTLADLAPAEDLLIAVGAYYEASGPPQLHWFSVDEGGALDLNHRCEGPSDEIFPVSLSTSSLGTVAIVDSLGRLVIGGAMAIVGTETQDRALLARFDLAQTGCALDETFTSNGWEVEDDESWCDTEDCEVRGLVEITPATGAVLTPRLVALVRAVSGGLGASRLFLLRLTAAGSPDTSFGGDGWVEILNAEMGTLFGETDLAIDALGRLYVLVTHSDVDAPLDLDVSVVRYQPNGSPDLAFGSGGRLAVSDQGSNDSVDGRAHRLVVGPEGSIFASASESGGSSATLIYTWRASDGHVLRLSFADTPSELAVQGNGRLVFARDRQSVADNFRGQRYLFTGASWALADETFGAGLSYVDYDVDLGGGDAEEVTAVTLWNGRVVYGGNASMVGTTGSFLMRTDSAFIFADGFEGRTPALWSTALGLAGPE